MVANANSAGLGGSESLVGISVPAGQYFVRVSGAQDAAQMYSLSMSANAGSVAQQPPVLGTIGNMTIATATTNVSSISPPPTPNNDPLTYTATAQSIEYHLDQNLNLVISGRRISELGGLNEKWLFGSGTWYLHPTQRKFYRSHGGSLQTTACITVEHGDLCQHRAVAQCIGQQCSWNRSRKREHADYQSERHFVGKLVVTHR